MEKANEGCSLAIPQWHDLQPQYRSCECAEPEYRQNILNMDSKFVIRDILDLKMSTICVKTWVILAMCKMKFQVKVK